jgi:hypothetical protein
MNNHTESYIIEEELRKADLKHGPMKGMVEGLHTIKCELAELEREVMREERNPEALVMESLQLAAMIRKFRRDCLEV